MRFKKIFKLNLIILLLFCFTKLTAQNIATPLEPEKAPTQRETGFLFGLGPNWQGGKFTDTCNCPSFKDGTRTGFSLGYLYEQDLSDIFQWGVALIWDSRGLTASFREFELMDATLPTTGQTVSTKVESRQKTVTDFMYATFLPYLKWSPWDFFYIKIGPSASYLFYSHMKHTKELLTTSARLSNGEVVNIRTDKGEITQTIYDDRFPGLNALQFGIEPMIGFNFYIGKNIFLSPGFMYSIPLTNLAPNGIVGIEGTQDFKSNSWRIFIELRMAIQMRYKRK